MNRRALKLSPGVLDAHGRADKVNKRGRAGLWTFALAVFLQSFFLLGADAEFRGKGVSEGGHQGTGSLGGSHSAGVGGAGSTGEAIQTGGENAPLLCDGAETLDLLFIGNSYTHYFEMPQLLAGMAESAGCRVNVEMVAPGGTRLAHHARSGETLSAIASRDWDAVILQNHSQLPSQPPKEVRRKTFSQVDILVKAIAENNPSTGIYFYVTWGRRDGDQRYCASNKLVCTFEGHTAALQRGYSMYAQEFNASLVNVGAAWERASVSKEAPFSHRELYDSDGSHPSLIGSYLAASVFFASFYRTSPEGLSYPRGLNEGTASFIQRIAATLPLSGA